MVEETLPIKDFFFTNQGFTTATYKSVTFSSWEKANAGTSVMELSLRSLQQRKRWAELTIFSRAHYGDVATQTANLLNVQPTLSNIQAIHTSLSPWERNEVAGRCSRLFPFAYYINSRLDMHSLQGIAQLQNSQGRPVQLQILGAPRPFSNWISSSHINSCMAWQRFAELRRARAPCTTKCRPGRLCNIHCVINDVPAWH